MTRIMNAVGALPNGGNYNYWRVTYNTNAPFINNAKDLINLLAKQGVNFNDCLMIGYSMGGVVSRSMIVQGFKPKALVTICTPHLGLAPWIPTPTPGTMSIAPWSNDLRNLNANPTDAAYRSKYYFFGITYNDIRGNHDDDAVVTYPSATANMLSGGIMRGKINLNYNGGFAGADPHSRGMDPNFLGPMLNTISRLL
jgi:pimeloyl-ACP methyl ester carboxylesterase